MPNPGDYVRITIDDEDYRGAVGWVEFVYLAGDNPYSTRDEFALLVDMPAIHDWSDVLYCESEMQVVTCPRFAEKTRAKLAVHGVGPGA